MVLLSYEVLTREIPWYTGPIPFYGRPCPTCQQEVQERGADRLLDCERGGRGSPV